MQRNFEIQFMGGTYIIHNQPQYISTYTAKKIGRILVKYISGPDNMKELRKYVEIWAKNPLYADMSLQEFINKVK